jgi:hypothetical protein
LPKIITEDIVATIMRINGKVMHTISSSNVTSRDLCRSSNSFSQKKRDFSDRIEIFDESNDLMASIHRHLNIYLCLILVIKSRKKPPAINNC